MSSADSIQNTPFNGPCDVAIVKKCRKEYFKRYRAKRKDKRDELLKMRREWISQCHVKTIRETGHIGFKAYRLTEKGELKEMPREYSFILKACEEFIDNPRRFPQLMTSCSFAVNREDTRINLAKILAVILARTQVIEGRVGVPSKSGMTTISETQLIHDYILRWGENIEPSKFSTYAGMLKKAGYLMYQSINFRIDGGEDSSALDSTEVRSVAAYKQLSNEFFVDLKVTSYGNIKKMLQATRERDVQKRRYSFQWVSFNELAERLMRFINAEKLNTIPLVPFHTELITAVAQRPPIH